jgi:hypothetical protein
MPPINDVASKPVAVHCPGVPAVETLLEPLVCNVEVTSGALLVTTVAAVVLGPVVMAVVCPVDTADTAVVITVLCDRVVTEVVVVGVVAAVPVVAVVPVVGVVPVVAVDSVTAVVGGAGTVPLSSPEPDTP